MTDKDGRDIAYTAEQTGGVLTVTVDEDFAVLTGRLSGLRTLGREAWRKSSLSPGAQRQRSCSPI